MKKNKKDIETQELVNDLDYKKSLNREMFFVSTPIIMFSFMIILFNVLIGTYYKVNYKAMFFTIFLLFIINIFLTLILGNQKRSVIFQFAILIILLFINKFRFMYTGEVFSSSDFAHVFQLSSITKIVSNTFGIAIIKCFPYLIAFLILVMTYILIIRKYNFSFKINFKKRILYSLIPLSILIILIFPPKFLRDFILDNFFYSKAVRRHCLTIEYYLENSVLGGMYMLYLDNKTYEPDNYDKKDIETTLSNFDESLDNQWKKSNIIVTFSESFFDVSLLEDDVTFDKEITSNFNSLKQEGIFINMITPSYGAKSANVEFQFLTGNTLNYFSSSYVPLMTFYKTEKSKNSMSLLKELKNNGYYTKVVFGKDYYRSEKSYENLGINEYEEKDIESEYKGYYTSEEYLMDETIKAFNEKEPGQKLFYMNCTIQSHQTYELEKYDTYDIKIENSALNEKQNNMLLSYSQGIYDADFQLRKNV